jgi:hypothetical protein
MKKSVTAGAIFIWLITWGNPGMAQAEQDRP